MATVEGKPRPSRREAAPVRQGVQLCLGMLRGGFGMANLALVVTAAVCWVLRGSTGAMNAAVAGVIVLVFAATGQAVQMLASDMADANGMVLVLGSYLARVAALGGLLWVAMAHQESLEPVLDRASLMAGALAVLAGWLGGVVWTHAHQRVSVFDSQWDEVSTRRPRVGGPK